MAEGRAHPRGEQFSSLNSQLAQAVGHFTQLLSSATAFGQAISQFRVLEQQLALTNAAAGGTLTTFRQMEVAARRFALATTASAQSAASALYFLAQAGYSVEQSMNALSGVMILAQATMEDVGFTSDLIASTLRTYNLTSLDSIRVANLFAAAQVNSLASLDKLAFSLRQVGPVAAAMGMDIETTTALLAELYNVGLRGEQAGTVLRNVMVRMVDMPASAKAVFKKYGIITRTATGELREFSDVLKDIYAKNLTEEDVAKLSGVEALAGMLTLIKSVGTGSFEKQRDTITGTAKAYEMAAAQLETLNGALLLAKNHMNDLAITIGKELAPYLVWAADAVSGLVDSFNALDGSTKGLIANIALITALVLTMLTVFKGLQLIIMPVISGLGGLFALFSAGSADGAKKAGLLYRGAILLGNALRWVFAGAMISSITNLGVAITGVTVKTASLRTAFTLLGTSSFVQLIAGLGGIGLAIAGAGGLIYTIYRISAAWREQTRITEEEVARQRAAILESVGISNSALDDLTGNAKRRETLMKMASGLTTIDQLTLFKGTADAADLDTATLQKMKSNLEEEIGSLLDLTKLKEEGVGLAERLASYGYEHAGAFAKLIEGLGIATAGSPELSKLLLPSNLPDTEAILAALDAQVSDSNTLLETVQEWVKAQFSDEAVTALENGIVEAKIRKNRADQQLAELVRAGITSGATFDEVTKTIETSQNSINSAQERIDHVTAVNAGSASDPAMQLLKASMAARDELSAALDAAVSDLSDGGGKITSDEAKSLSKLQFNLSSRVSELAKEMQNSITAAQQSMAVLIDNINTNEGQSTDSRIALTNKIRAFIAQIINLNDAENIPITEFFGPESDKFREFLGTVSEEAAKQLGDIMLRDGINIGKNLFSLLTEMSARGEPVPKELLDWIESVTTKPIRQLTVQIQTNRAKLNMEIARFKNELALTQADIADNLPSGIEAEGTKAILDTIDEYQKQAETIAKTIETSLGAGWADIQITEQIAEALGIQYQAGMDLGDFLNTTGFLDGVAAAAANGASADELAAMTDVAITTFIANLVSSLAAVSKTMVEAKTMTAESAAELNATLSTIVGLLNAVRENRQFIISDAPRAATAGSKYKPQEKKGRTVEEEALKLKTDFEKELRSIQKDLLGIEKDILEFDNTIDLTARFTAMLDIDRKEIAQKYEQRIQELKSAIEQANIDFAKQPAYLSQLITGYNTLISQLERAKEAELAYTNTFTYQSKLRNDAIDRQIDAIRNLSMEGQQAGASIMQGVKAGLLLYQKDLKTVVDNVAQATVGVLDGLAEAVGAFVTGSGDALDILRNAVLSSLNELIVSSTKRILQNLFAGVTGGTNPAVTVDPMQEALLTASTKTQIVYTNHLTQLQGILSGFAAGFGQALSSVVATVNGAGPGAVGAIGVIPGAAPLVASVQGGVSAAMSVVSPLWDLGKTVGTSIITNLRDGIFATAQELQINPLDLAAAISYETGGTFNPLQPGPTTQWGQHQGLIQFGEPQAAQYGADFSSELAALQSQLGPNGAIVNYLRGSGFKNGMGMMDLYSTINAGGPGLYNASDAANGGAPGTVADKVNQQMAGHFQNAERLLGDFNNNLGTIATDTQTAANQFNTGMQDVTQQYPVGTLVNQPAGLAVTSGEAQQMQTVYMQFLQQLQAVLMQFLQQFSVTMQQANAGGGLAVPGMSSGILGGGVPSSGVASAGGAIQQQMGGFMDVIMSLLQSLMGGLSSVLQGLLSSVLGGIGGGGSFFGLFDDGGKIPQGKWGIAGENGPEIINGPATVMSRVDTQNYLKRSNEPVAPAPVQEPPIVNNIIVQDPSLVGKYLATRSGRRQILNIVNGK